MIEERLYKKVVELRNDYNKTFTKRMITGGALILLSPMPLLIAAALTNYADAAFALTVPIMLFMIGLAGYIFAQALFIKQSYFAILNRAKIYKKSLRFDE